jgi:hypothetical protein
MTELESIAGCLGLGAIALGVIVLGYIALVEIRSEGKE